MDQKRALLDAALDTFDGNCITTVLLFIRKTQNHRELDHLFTKLCEHTCGRRDSDEDGESETKCCESLLQLSEAAPRLEGTHPSLSVSIIHTLHWQLLHATLDSVFVCVIGIEKESYGRHNFVLFVS